MSATQSYCTQKDFEIAPGLRTHDLSTAEVLNNSAYGCCQKYVCGLPCPIEFDRKGVDLSFGIPVVLYLALLLVSAWILGWLFVGEGDYKNYFICNRSLPLFVVVMTLINEGVDINSVTTNVSLVYRYSFWDGILLPFANGICLILNGLFLAGSINKMRLLTLPELFKRQYGCLSEVLVTLIELGSFMLLMASDLLGVSMVLDFVFQIPKVWGVLMASMTIVSYGFMGGLLSVAFMDVLQASLGLTGFVTVTLYMLMREEPHAETSLGFVINIGNTTVMTPSYSGPHDCFNPITNASTCDNYAYPLADPVVVWTGMSDPDAYAPFPNSILYNWGSTIVMMLGNLCALDYQSRTIAARSPAVARAANIIAGVVIILVFVPFGLLGGIARKYYGPDSASAAFNSDSCSAPLGLPSCAEWLSDDPQVLFKLFWEKMPRILGAWGMLGTLTAAFSTCNGCALACTGVIACNLLNKVPGMSDSGRKMLLAARLCLLPIAGLACAVACLAKSAGYLLIVAFDIVLASVFVPLIAAVYLPGVRPNAGILASVAGGLLRIALEFGLPKDGSMVVLGKWGFTYGPAVPGLPPWLEVQPPEAAAAVGLWDPVVDTCHQEKLRDWSGLDTMVSPLFSLLVLLVVNYYEALTGHDTLSFIPKSWRQQSPLYPLEEEETVDAEVCTHEVIQ